MISGQSEASCPSCCVLPLRRMSPRLGSRGGARRRWGWRDRRVGVWLICLIYTLRCRSLFQYLPERRMIVCRGILCSAETHEVGSRQRETRKCLMKRDERGAFEI